MFFHHASLLSCGAFRRATSSSEFSNFHISVLWNTQTYNDLVSVRHTYGSNPSANRHRRDRYYVSVGAEEKEGVNDNYKLCAVRTSGWTSGSAAAQLMAQT